MCGCGCAQAAMQFPFELVFPVIVGRFMSSHGLLAPFIAGYPKRIMLCAVAMVVVATYPTVKPGESAHESFHFVHYAGLFLLQSLLSLASNLMFVSMVGARRGRWGPR